MVRASVMAVLLLSGTVVSAQSIAALLDRAHWVIYPHAMLSGATMVSVDATEDQDKKFQCFPGANRMKLAASRALMDAGLRVTQYLDDVPVLEVRTISIDQGRDLCAAHVTVRLMSSGYSAMPHQQIRSGPFSDLMRSSETPYMTSVTRTKVLLAERASLFTGTPNDFRQRLADFAKQATEEIATEIRLANQK